jgi:urease accessory protein
LSPPADAHVQDGLAELRLERRQEVTRLTSVRTRSPLAVQRALYPDQQRPDMAHVILVNPTAGLLTGDRLGVDIEVGKDARARVTTQAATKVFSMPSGNAEQRLTLTVQAGGWLEYLPHALIPFPSACLEQRMDLTVASGGTAVYGDVLSLGRVESGERLAFRSLAMALTVRRPDGTGLYIECYRLDPTEGVLDAPGILGGTTSAAVGTLIFVSDGATPEALCDALRQYTGEQLASVAPLPGGGGVILKAIASSASRAESVIQGAVERCLAALS